MRTLLTSRLALVLIAFSGIAAYFLIREHTVHVTTALPWLLLAACPLLPVFLHRGHETGHDGHQHHEGQAAQPKEKM